MTFNALVDVAGKLTVSQGTLLNGILTVCPGELISITCTHNMTNGQPFTRWILPDTTQCIVGHEGETPLGCSPFSFINESNSSGQTLTSTVLFKATESLNGTVIECLAGGLISSPQVGNVTIHLKGKYNKQLFLTYTCNSKYYRHFPHSYYMDNWYKFNNQQ